MDSVGQLANIPANDRWRHRIHVPKMGQGKGLVANFILKFQIKILVKEWPYNMVVYGIPMKKLKGIIPLP